MSLREPVLSRRDLLAWTLEVLREHSIKPSKRLSQNFVVEPRVIFDVLDRVNPSLSTMEIGAGLGTLSYYLAKKCRRALVLYEIDYRLVRALSELVREPNSVVVRGDAISQDWLVEQVVSNAPYHITSEILVKLARSNEVKRAVLLLQRDVVDRLCSRPGSENYGRITVLVNVLFRAERGPIYSPQSFYPPPKVSSQLLVLERARNYDDEVSLLEAVTGKIFSKRRKRAAKVLSEELGLSSRDIEELGLEEDKRVYELSPSDVLQIVRLLRRG